MDTLQAKANGQERSTMRDTDGIFPTPTGPRLPPWNPYPWPTFPISEERNASPVSFGTGSAVEALEALYLRPDVRAAIADNARVLMDILSRDEEAAKIFDELTGGHLSANPMDDPTERVAPLVIIAVMGGAAAAGALVGYLSRP